MNLPKFDKKFPHYEALGRALQLLNEKKSPIFIMKTIREEYDIGLADAKRVYQMTWTPAETKAHEEFITELIPELDKPDTP